MQCGTSVIGEFQPTIFSRLSPENLAFLEVFIKNKGNVKEMERELGESYWAIRNVRQEMIHELRKLGFKGLDMDTLVEMRIHGLSAKRATKAKEVLGDDFSAEQLIAWQIHGELVW
ncbi:MAG: DUF2089 family protein [Chloroflexi bacterium]|nr:DUF2089 family protein [Ardenticatenaceae bacterium]NOG35985.1 DUF2089 family protein [Chloroflexota bacterium]GIK55436.1 MAG: hypothetical protein BroJett015_10990 [Chloroflexota bacterium]